jgi:hypothetical protein
MLGRLRGKIGFDNYLSERVFFFYQKTGRTYGAFVL